jgi:hypothetical protein
MAATGKEQWQALDAATAAISKFGPFKSKFSLERLVIKFRNDLRAFIEGTDRPKTAPLDFTKVDGNKVVSSIQKLFDQTTGQFSMGCIDLKVDEDEVSADLAGFYSERARRVNQLAADKVGSDGDAASELYALNVPPSPKLRRARQVQNSGFTAGRRRTGGSKRI